MTNAPDSDTEVSFAGGRSGALSVGDGRFRRFDENTQFWRGNARVAAEIRTLSTVLRRAASRCVLNPPAPM
jgi:hypothetical protein